ncbi:orotate phosphoribosyltransferase [Deinococcus sp. KNUC1210]|uniref:orotate phosphoribosyltransferase n=1 Tax=Deinococcus sp. KNUC1210 TaxID=2917691 RepID=UPI001EF14FFF|nr:orotate phosphoribosyltransferase [Deinococcus sp. KNUC1210]ULH16686.1 orotate phosphoribosyltransferase [Deinococcus sp. KNUC1210]
MDVLSLYRQAGAFHEGHFLLASGRHSPMFLQSTTLLQHPAQMQQIGAALAQKVLDAGYTPDFVIGPAMGGVVLAYEVARNLTHALPEIRAIFAEKDGQGGMKIREAFTVQPGQTFIAVEDVLTTGGSVLKAVRATEQHGATCLAVAIIIDRRRDAGPLQGIPLLSLEQLYFDTYAPDEVPEWLAARELQEI